MAQLNVATISTRDPDTGEPTGVSESAGISKLQLFAKGAWRTLQTTTGTSW